MAEPLRPIADRRPEPAIEIRSLSVATARRTLLEAIDLEIAQRTVTAIVGPSGSGKTTLLKAINRLLDLADPQLRVQGQILHLGRDIYSPEIDADALRSEVGMLFQQPVVFPRSIAKNVLFGAERLERLRPREKRERLEQALGEAALWHEVKDRLDHPAAELSVGQQQRLCLARALATRPGILLMDEPTSALDPAATALIEELIVELAKERAVVVVTHDLTQARRIAGWACFLSNSSGIGRLLEAGCCPEFLDRPRTPEAIAYLRRPSQ